MDVIPEMTDGELQQYLPCKGDRVAVQAFSRSKRTHEESNNRRVALVESLRSRMGLNKTHGKPTADDANLTESTGDQNKTARQKSSFFVNCKSCKNRSGNQAAIATKPDRALVVGFCIYQPIGEYRQVRAPMGGGIRHLRVDKNMKKEEVLEIICSLFFQEGSNMHGTVDNFHFDISTDVHGTTLMHDTESVEDIINRLGLKHLRCYLLAKRHGGDLSDSGDSLPDICIDKSNANKGKNCSKDLNTIDPIDAQSIDSADKSQQINVTDITDDSTPTSPTDQILLNIDDISQTEFTVVSQTVETSNFQPQPEELMSSILVLEDTADSNIIDFDLYKPEMTLMPDPDIPKEYVEEDILSRVMNDSGVIAFGALQPDMVKLDDTLPVISEITVHRGSVCRDLINFFSLEENLQSNNQSFEIKMLKEDGTPEAAEDNGGVMRDALTEFWDTFYLQYTEGNIYKVPVLRHDMTDVQWKAVAAVINMGFKQEGVYPIKLAPSFMQQAVFGSCNDSDLIESFLQFVSVMDRMILDAALKDYESVEVDDIHDVLEQYGAKTIIKTDTFPKVVKEIAHKELVQKPMFVADCFHRLLHSSTLLHANMGDMYSNLKPSTKKVLKCLQFPEHMSQDETTLSLYIKRLVREMDDPEYLGLFLRFCTGSDIMAQSKIHIRFTSNDHSNNVRCATSHTCGCVLEIPRSYALDPYVILRADFLTMLKNRYWQMDIV